MGEKRFYWLKLKEDFFSDETIRYIEEQDNGYKYSNIYLKLLLKSIDGQGVLIRKVGSRLIPYDVAAIAKMTGHDQDTVRVAMKLLEELGMVERMESGALYMSQLREMVGSESSSAGRVRAHRERQKQLPEPEQCNEYIPDFSTTAVTLPLHCNADVTPERYTGVTGALHEPQNCNPRYIDIRDKNKEKKNIKRKENSDEPKGSVVDGYIQPVTEIVDYMNQKLGYIDIRDKNKEKKNIKRKENSDEPKGSVVDGYIQPVTEIVDYMNQKLGTHYKPKSQSTQKHIVARLKEGYSVEDFRKVIDKKCAQWMGSSMAKYLRPETLFGSKFEGYLNEQTYSQPEEPKFTLWDERGNL